MKDKYKWYDYTSGVIMMENSKWCWKPYIKLKPKPTPNTTLILIAQLSLLGVLLSWIL